MIAAPAQLRQREPDLFPPDAETTPVARITGGEVDTFVFATPTGSIRVELLAVPAQWQRATAVSAALRQIAADLPGHPQVRDGLPLELGPGAFATVVFSPVEPAAEALRRDLSHPDGAANSWPWLPSLSRRLGEHLRLRHEETRGLATLPALAVPNPVIARVERLLAGPPRQPARMSYLAGTVNARPRLRRALSQAITACHGKRRDRVLLHGRYAPAAILRATDDSGFDVVTAWLDAMQGPPAYDLGYFIGELAECEALARTLGRTAAAACCRRAIAAFLGGYAAGDPRLPRTVVSLVAPFAALKLVEHVARFTQRFGPTGSNASDLITTADDLLDPRGWLIRLLAES